MKFFKLTSLVIIVNLAISSSVLAGNGPGHGNATNPPQDNAALANDVDTSITLNDTEETNLSFMREEEKLARDVYLHLFDVWAANIFSNIARAEQSHMDSVKVILDAYRLTDPAPVDRGFFTDPDLQELYNNLIIKGQISLIDALKVGALIEEVDIKDLYKSINETNNPAIIQVYTQLLNGSYKHLNAFVSQLNAQGVNYESQILSSDEVKSILSGETFNAEIVDGLALSVDNITLQTQSRFSHTILLESGTSENNAAFSENESIKLSSHFIPEAEDLGQKVDYFTLVNFKPENGNNVFFTREGQQWTTWNGHPENLGRAEQQTLKEVQNFNIFDGKLNNLQGTFNIYTGYILNTGKIVFSAEPLSFMVN